MAKKLIKNRTEEQPAELPVEPESEPAEMLEAEPDVLDEPSDSEPAEMLEAEPDVLDEPSDSEPVLDPEPEVEATLAVNQCPRCRHVSSAKAVRLGPPQRQTIRGVFHGVEYGVIETRRIMCEKCKQVHFVKKYL